MSAAINLIKILCPNVTTPARVMATKPTMAPMRAPLLSLICKTGHKNPGNHTCCRCQIGICKCDNGIEICTKADPALNPNQPTQSKPVPKITNGIFAGFSSIFSFPEGPRKSRQSRGHMNNSTSGKINHPHFLKGPQMPGHVGEGR